MQNKVISKIHFMDFNVSYRKPINKISIRKVRIYLFFIVPFTFFCDLLYGSFNYLGLKTHYSPGIFVRGIIVVLSFLLILKTLNERKKIFFIIVPMLLLPSLFLGILKEFKFFDLFFNIRIYFKAIYGLMLFNFLIYLNKRYFIDIEEILNLILISGILLSSFIILPYLLGFGFYTYGDYTYGFKGLIIANNDLSLALIISFLIGLFILTYNFSISNLIKVIYIIFALSLIGTRAALFSLLLVPFSVLFVYIFGKSNKEIFPFVNIKRKLFILFILLLLLIVSSGVFFFLFSNIMENKYQRQKIEILLNKQMPRYMLIESGVSYLKTRSFYFNLFGEGMFSYMKGVYNFYPGYSEKELKLVEVDWIDIFGGYGIVGVLLLYGFFIFWFVDSLIKFLRKKFIFYGLVCTGLVVYIGHSALAGHAIMSPMPTSLVVLLILANIIFEKRYVYSYPYRHRS